MMLMSNVACVKSIQHAVDISVFPSRDLHIASKDGTGVSIINDVLQNVWIKHVCTVCVSVWSFSSISYTCMVENNDYKLRKGKANISLGIYRLSVVRIIASVCNFPVTCDMFLLTNISCLLGFIAFHNPRRLPLHVGYKQKISMITICFLNQIVKLDVIIDNATVMPITDDKYCLNLFDKHDKVVMWLLRKMRSHANRSRNGGTFTRNWHFHSHWWNNESHDWSVW